MRRVSTLLFLVAVVAACKQQKEPKATAPIGIAKMAPAGDVLAIAPLVPTDATLLLRISSVEKLEEITNRLRTELPVPLPADVLSLMTAMVGQEPAIVERGRPVFLCASLGEEKDAPPRFTLIAPVKDPGAIAKALPGGGRFVTADYAAFSQQAGYKAGGSPLAAGILDGDISARCDLVRIVSTYRADIEEALRGFEEGFASGARHGLPSFEPAEMTARITDWLRKLVDSAETLDAVVNHKEGLFDLQLALTASETSPLARAAARTKSELVQLGRCLPPDMPVTMLVRFDVAATNDLFLPLLSALMEKRPAEERQAMEGDVRRMNEAAELLTDDWAMALDFGKDGMRLAMVGGARDAQAYLATYRDMLQTPTLGQMGLAFRSEGSREVAGTTVERMRMTIDAQKYIEFLGMEELGAEAIGSASAVLALMLGENGLAFELAAQENRVFFAAGPGGELMDSMLAADDPPAWLEGTAAAIGGELGFLVRLEVRGCMRGASEMIARLAPGMPGRAYPGGEDLPVVLYGSVDGRVYRGGMTCNLGELAAFFRGGQR
ncbi:MAG: hypothetical protein ACYS0K_03160 [Planctomycetota bacterium]|jgi:hypothetical protein